MGRPLKHNLAGKKFGRLTVIEHVGSGNWKCVCECGNETVVGGHDLVAGKCMSCGCEKSRRFTEMNVTHGMSGTRLYRVWRNMITRCTNPKSEKYPCYGGRGITICDEWRNDFSQFFEWAMANGYDPDAPYGECTLDRIDVNGNYEPSNCRWADAATQANNRREHTHAPTHMTKVQAIDEDGNVLCEYPSIAEASRQTGCNSTSIVAVCAGRYKHSLGLKWQYA